jgi:hypothetical protein
MNEGSSLRALLPADKGDVARARSLVALGYPAVRDVLSDIFGWLRDGNWPVFQVFAPFVASLGSDIVPHIKNVLSTDDDVWKYWVLSEVVRSVPQTILDDLRLDLERIRTKPTPGEAEEELDRVATELLDRTPLPEESQDSE